MTKPEASKLEVVTMGCRLNAFESEVMRRHAEAAGLDDAVIVNTCAVTGEAERQARQTIRRLRRDRPDARIIVTGCAAQIHADQFAAMPEVDQVLGNEEKLRADSYRSTPNEAPILVSDIMQVAEIAGHLIGGFESRTRAFVQVQQGCDHRCTFCIIPFGRGNNRSVPADSVIAQIAELAANGYREVVLTGVDISSYGMDFDARPGLGKLAHRILREVPELPRLRLSSLDPAVIDEDIFDLLATEPRLMPHLHLSAQAGDDLVLKRMKRRHSRADFISLADKLRDVRPDVVLGADLIAGFPTETEEMFQNSLDMVTEAGLVYLHVFPYSERPGTPAARMPSVAKSVRQERARRLRAVGDAAKIAYFRSRVGGEADILIEQAGRGYTEHYAPVRLDSSDSSSVGALVRARIEDVEDGNLIATLPAQAA